MHVLYLSGCRGDTQRYRCHHPAEQLRRRGHTAEVIWHADPATIDAAVRADIVVLHRPPQTQFLSATLDLAAGRPLVYETDDLIFDPAMVDQIPIVQETDGLQQQYWRNYALSNARVLELCHAATTSTTPLADQLTTAERRVWIHPNVLSDELLALSEQAYQQRSAQRPLTLGYFSGSHSHSKDLAVIAPVLSRLLGRHTTLRLLLAGHVRLPVELAPFAARIEQRPFIAWHELPASMADADVLLAPLELDNPFACARSELKYLEAAALHLPLIASPTPAFAGAIRQGETGLLADEPDAWEQALEALLGDPVMRQRIGDSAAQHVRQSYTFEAAAPALERIMQQILDNDPAAQQRATFDLRPVREQWNADLRLQDQSVYLLTGAEVGNSATYRCRHRQQQLDLHEIRSVVVSQFPDNFVFNHAINHELAILHRVPETMVTSAYIRMMQTMGRPVLFDTDDLVFRPELVGYVDAIKDWSEGNKALYIEGVERYRRTLLACDAVIVSTEPLTEHVRELGKPAFVVRNALSWQQLERAAPLAAARVQQPLERPDGMVLAGFFSGTATHNRDFMEIAPALLRVLQSEPRLRLRIVGLLDLGPEFAPFADRIERRDVVPLVELAAELAEVDFALVPLELGNPYCEAKSEVRYMEAGSVAVPLIASPIEAFRVAICHGQTGMLATTTEEWVAAIQAMLDDPARPRALGMAAREDVLRRYTPAARSRALQDVLAAAWATTEQVRTSTSFSDVFLKSLALYQEMALASEQKLQELAGEVALSRYSESHLQQQLAISQQAEQHLHQHLAMSHQAAEWLQHQLATTQEHARAAEQEAQILRTQINQIAGGRVMRTLNALSRWRTRR